MRWPPTVKSACALATRRAGLFFLALLLALTSFVRPAVGLDSTLKISQYSQRLWATAAGLPIGALWAIHESADGFLWLGGEGGLIRFDGVNFVVYNSSNHSAFAVDDVRAIVEAPDGAIWAATFGGGLVRVAGDRLTRFDSAAGLVDNIVYSLASARDGSIWAGTARGLCQLRDAAFTCWTDRDGLAHGRISKIVEAADGTIWASTLAGGVSAFDGTDFRTYTTADGLASPQILLLADDPELGVFLATYAGDIHRATADGPVAVEFPGLPPGLTPVSTTRDRDGNLWMGMNAKQGIWQLQPSVRRLDRPDAPVMHAFGMLTDDEGSLWVVSSEGLYRFRAGPFVPWGAAEGLSDSTYVLAEGPDGAIWAGTESTGLFRLRPGDGAMTRFTRAEGLPVDSVSSLFVDSDGTLWAGTFGGGVAVLKDERIVAIIDEDDGLASNQVASIFRDAAGYIWVGTSAGLNRLDGTDVIQTLRAGDGLPTDLVRHINQDIDGNLLLSTDSGLAVLEPALSKVTRVHTKASGLASGIVACTLVDADGTVWLGSRSGGLARLRGAELFQYRPEHRLGIDSVMGIVEDQWGYLWLAGRRGIVRIAKAELNAVADGQATSVAPATFSENDGLRSVRVPGGFQAPMILSSQGHVWLATSEGLATVDPDRLSPRLFPGAPRIDAVRVDGQRLRTGPPFVIAAGSGSVELDYTLPSLIDGESVDFAYRVSGSASWMDAGERRTAFLNGLPPRLTVFEVAARYRGQPLAEAAPVTTTVQLFVEPRWYQTYIANVIGLTLFALLLVGGYRVALGGYRKREKNLELLVAERTRALRDALSEVERMSLTDALTGVANRRHFEMRLAGAWEMAVSDKAPLSVVMIDIDYFKQFNDVAGHLAGDQCLHDVALALSESLRDTDFIARFGGEEFVVLLPGSDDNIVRAIASRLQRSIRGLGIEHPGRPPRGVVTVSAGFATASPGVIDSAEELVRRADDALYEAKAKGRDCLVFDRSIKAAG